MSSVEFDVANAMVEGIENNFKGKSYKKVDFFAVLWYYFDTEICRVYRNRAFVRI